MLYENEAGFSFELADTWSHNKNYHRPTFHGPDHVGLIELGRGAILPQYIDPASRELYLAEPGATISRTKVGGEINAVVLRKANETEISIVRDGVQYIISHLNDAESETAIELLKKTWRFPSASQARDAIKASSNPESQGLERAFRAGSPEEVNKIFSEADIRGQSIAGGTAYDLRTYTATRKLCEGARRWWQFWKS